MRRQTLQPAAIAQGVAPCVRTSPDGVVPNVHQGALPAQAHRVARDVAQDVGSPPLSVRRMEGDEGERVTDHDRSHRPDRMAHATVPVAACLGRRVPHVRPKGCKRIRSDGVQAPKTFAKGKAVIQAALAQVEGLGKGAGQIIARLTSRQRYEQRTGRDPFRGPHGGEEMAVWRIWHPQYGGMYDEGDVIQRGTYASTAQRAGP